MNTIQPVVPLIGIALALGLANLIFIIQSVRMDKRIDRLESSREAILRNAAALNDRILALENDHKAFRADLGAMQGMLLKHDRMLGEDDFSKEGYSVGGTTDDPISNLDHKQTS